MLDLGDVNTGRHISSQEADYMRMKKLEQAQRGGDQLDQIIIRTHKQVDFQFMIGVI